MKTITLTNADGDTIEIKCGPGETINIRHSDINPNKFGEFHEYSKRLRQPQIEAGLKAKGIDLTAPGLQEMTGKLGGYMVIDGQSFMIGHEETNLILDAIRQNGGIIPNWSNRP